MFYKMIKSLNLLVDCLVINLRHFIRSWLSNKKKTNSRSQLYFFVFGRLVYIEGKTKTVMIIMACVALHCSSISFPANPGSLFITSLIPYTEVKFCHFHLSQLRLAHIVLIIQKLKMPLILSKHSSPLI